MKSFNYESLVDSSEYIVARIVDAARKINMTPGIFGRVCQSFIHQCKLCSVTIWLPYSTALLGLFYDSKCVYAT